VRKERRPEYRGKSRKSGRIPSSRLASKNYQPPRSALWAFTEIVSYMWKMLADNSPLPESIRVCLVFKERSIPLANPRSIMCDGPIWPCCDKLLILSGLVADYFNTSEHRFDVLPLLVATDAATAMYFALSSVRSVFLIFHSEWKGPALSPGLVPRALRIARPAVRDAQNRYVH
jgi:hypothetical protein